MRKLAIALMILVASAAYSEKVKNKVKDKRFEAAVKTVSEYAGSYRGPSELHGLILELHNGQLVGNYVELGRMAVLTPVEIDGAEFTASASFADGSVKTIHGSFATRILNGNRAFGLRVYDVPVEGYGAINTFFEKVR